MLVISQSLQFPTAFQECISQLSEDQLVKRQSHSRAARLPLLLLEPWWQDLASVAGSEFSKDISETQGCIIKPQIPPHADSAINFSQTLSEQRPPLTWSK